MRKGIKPPPVTARRWSGARIGLFYPHTNDDVLATRLLLDDCDERNWPLLVPPGSHKGPTLRPSRRRCILWRFQAGRRRA